MNGERIRIVDIDAPESFESRCHNELKLALKAKERLRALLNSGPLRVNVGQTLLAEDYVLRYRPGTAAKEARLKAWCGPWARLPG